MRSSGRARSVSCALRPATGRLPVRRERDATGRWFAPCPAHRLPFLDFERAGLSGHFVVGHDRGWNGLRRRWTGPGPSSQMLPPRRGPAGGLLRGDGLFGNPAHGINRPEHRLLIHGLAPFLPDLRDGRAMLPQCDRRVSHGPVRHFDVVAALRAENPDAAQISGVASDDEPGRMVALFDPRLKAIAHVSDVVQDETITPKLAAFDR